MKFTLSTLLLAMTLLGASCASKCGTNDDTMWIITKPVGNMFANSPAECCDKCQRSPECLVANYYASEDDSNGKCTLGEDFTSLISAKNIVAITGTLDHISLNKSTSTLTQTCQSTEDTGGEVENRVKKLKAANQLRGFWCQAACMTAEIACQTGCVAAPWAEPECSMMCMNALPICQRAC